MKHKNFAVFISGPTGVGKSDLALKLAQQLPAEIVNADVGQFYTPLSVGTAKPDWRASSIPHHLFDVLDAPEHFTVWHYRKKLLATIADITERGRLPLIVGGSGFYLKSVFFPPKVVQADVSDQMAEKTEDLWKRLHVIDPERAERIHKNDRYRIERALAIWKTTGTKPSAQQPAFDCPLDFFFIWATRERSELYERINQRTHVMLKSGWLEEVAQLRDTPWESFLRKKKLIGYDLILAYLVEDQTAENFEQLVQTIQKRTRNYAKRQETFWRMLARQLQQVLDAQKKGASEITSVDLTLLNLNLYINQLSKRIKNRIN